MHKLEVVIKRETEHNLPLKTYFPRLAPTGKWSTQIYLILSCTIETEPSTMLKSALDKAKATGEIIDYGITVHNPRAILEELYTEHFAHLKKSEGDS